MDFKELLAKTKAKKEFSKARSVKNESVPDGKYHVRLKEYEFSLNDKGTPRAIFRWEATRGEHKGHVLTQAFMLNEWKGKDRNGKSLTITVQDKYEQMFRQLQVAGIETDVDPEEIEEQLDELIEDQTVVVVTATTKKEFQNIKIVSVIKSESDDTDNDDDDDDDDDEDEDDDESESEDDDDDEDDEEDDEDEDDDDEEDYIPEKGDEVAYKLGKAKATQWEVTSVNRSKQTVALKRNKDGHVKKDVPWSELVQ